MTAVRGSEARQRQIQYRSERILESALELFCEKGIQETSVEEIAGKAGVGSATIYRYYSTKAELAIQSGVAYWEKIAGPAARLARPARLHEGVLYLEVPHSALIRELAPSLDLFQRRIASCLGDGVCASIKLVPSGSVSRSRNAK